MKKKEDLNKRGEFNKWLVDNFSWVDVDVKSYMFKAWCGRGTVERKSNQPQIEGI